MQYDADNQVEPDGWRALRADAMEVVRGLCDFRLRTNVTTTMAPAIYTVLVSAVVILNVTLALDAFRRSTGAGLIWLLLIMPAATVVGVVTIRVILESLLTLFRISLRLETLLAELENVSGRTESIAGRVEDLPLPRIQFWRPRRRDRKDKPDA